MSSIAISSCPSDQLDLVRPLLAQASQKPYRYLAPELGADLDDYWFQDLAGSVQDGDGELFLASQGGQLVGMIALTPLPWETRVLGRPMAALKHLGVGPENGDAFSTRARLLAAATQAASERGIHGLLCKTHTDDIPTIHALETHGFLLVDTLLDFIFDYRRNPLTPDWPSASTPWPSSAARPTPGRPQPAGDVQVRIAGSGDEQELCELALASFGNHFGRFHADPNISHQEAVNVYVEWIRSCVRGYADWIIVAEIDGKLAGYSAWKKPSPLEASLKARVGHYSIAGIHPHYFGRGLFSLLTVQGMRQLDGSAELIEGPTHINNYPVQRGYANLRWRIGDARHAFHKWLTV